MDPRLQTGQADTSKKSYRLNKKNKLNEFDLLLKIMQKTGTAFKVIYLFILNWKGLNIKTLDLDLYYATL